MSLKVSNIMSIMDEYAPASLKEDYDNVGLMIGNPKNEVTSILAALDCTMDVIDEAVNLDCNLIFTHHPLLFKKPRSITNETLQGRKIIKIIEHNINVYSSHTNLDSAVGGIADKLIKILNFDNYSMIESKDSRIGRYVKLKDGIELKKLCLKVKNSLGISNLRYVGKDSMNINKIAILNGSGESFFDYALSLGVNCIITGDTSYHYMSDLKEEGIAVIDAEHFGTEWPAFKEIALMLKNKINEKGFKNKVIISKESINPYKYI